MGQRAQVGFGLAAQGDKSAIGLEIQAHLSQGQIGDILRAGHERQVAPQQSQLLHLRGQQRHRILQFDPIAVPRLFVIFREKVETQFIAGDRRVQKLQYAIAHAKNVARDE